MRGLDLESGGEDVKTSEDHLQDLEISTDATSAQSQLYSHFFEDFDAVSRVPAHKGIEYGHLESFLPVLPSAIEFAQDVEQDTVKVLKVIGKLVPVLDLAYRFHQPQQELISLF